MVMCDNQAVQKPFDIETLRRRLSEIMGKKGIRPTTLSLRVGTSPTLVQDLLNKTKDTKLSTVFKLADELNVPVSDLLADDIVAVPTGPQLYLKGEVAAGQWVEAFEWAQEDWQVLTGRPDITADIKHRFFLRIIGDSMDQIYPPESLIECVSVFGQAKPEPGKRVVVTRMRHDGLVEATVKELVDLNGELWLVPRSSNPEHQSFKADEVGDGIEEVRIIAVVVASVRPE